MKNYRNYTKSAIAPMASIEPLPHPLESSTTADSLAALEEARHCWENLEEFRRNRRRCRRYTYGNQWGDTIYDPDQRAYTTEEQYITRQGKVPLKNNLIRQLVKSVLGQFRNNQVQPVCVARDRNEQKTGEMMSIALQYNYQLNRMDEIDARALEEFLISGLAVARTNFGWKTGRDKVDVWTDLVNPNRLFFDSLMQDTRHWDCNLVGEIHDMQLDDVVSAFATSSTHAQQIRSLYHHTDGLNRVGTALSADRVENLTFFTNTDGLCRVIEVWRRESKPRIKCHDLLKGEYYKVEEHELAEIERTNRQRIAEAAHDGVPPEQVPTIETEWFVDRYWYFRYLTPDGEVLQEGESPFWHKEHPYSFKLYPFVDGQVHSFVADVIDQQRYINRLITLIDFIMGASAKGVLIFPEEAVPEGMTLEQVADEWTRYNGVILCKSKPGVAMPQQISTNATNVGAFELLNIQLQLLSDISGVHGAGQGREALSGTSGTLYAQQSANAATNLLDLLATFRCFREERDTKCMKLIQQYYTQPRYINIAGNNYGEESRNFDPEQVRNTEFDLTIADGNTTPAYRLMADQFLLELFKAGQIDVEMLLANGSFPFADQLLQEILARRENENKQDMA